MKRPIHPAYAELADNYHRESLLITQAFEDAKQNNLEKLHTIRKNADAYYSKLELPEVVRYQKQIPGPNDSTVTLTVFRPPGTENQILPIIIHSHGGGFVLGSVKSYAKAAIDYCLEARAMVVFVEYSLSPEVRYPVAIEEVYSSLCWVKENANSIQGNPDKIAVIGDSAGGNISAIVSNLSPRIVMAKDRGLSEVIKAQVLLYPTLTALSGYPSYEQYGQGNYVLSAKDIIEFNDMYTSDKNDLPKHYAKPLTSTVDQLKGLPPALVLTSQCDVLRDEGEEYATKLLEAGVEVVGMRVLGTTHGFMSHFPSETPQYKCALKTAIEFIKEKLDY